MANGDLAAGPSGVPRITIRPPTGYGGLAPIDEEAASAAAQGFSGLAPIGAEAETPTAAQPPQQPAASPTASMPERLLADFQNVQRAAEQRTTPNIAIQQPYLLGPAHTNEEGDVGYLDQGGQFVPADASQHVVLTDPNDNTPKVFLRNEATRESPAVGVARVLAQGFGPGGLRTVPPPSVGVPELKAAARAVYNDPQILGRTVDRADVVGAMRNAATDLEDFSPAVADRIREALKGPYATVRDLRNISGPDSALNDIVNETQMTPGGIKSTSAAAAAKKVQDRIEGLIGKVAPEIGQVADPNWSAAMAAETLSGRAGKAEVYARGGDFAARMKTQATQLLANPRNLRGFTPQEIEQLHQISEGTMSGEMLRTIKPGKLTAMLLGGIAGHEKGGLIGAAVGAGVAMPLEAGLENILTRIGNRLAANQVNKLSQAIRARSPLAQALRQKISTWEAARHAGTSAPPQILAATARELAQALNSVGVNVSPTQFMGN